MAYWIRTSPTTLAPTAHVGGAWSESQQHIAPAFGVLVHEVERHLAARREAPLPVVSRLSYDILGPIPLEPLEIEVEVLRPGRSIELVQATARHDGRAAVLLRAWLCTEHDTAALAGTHLPPVPRADELDTWDGTATWPGGFIASVELRRRELAAGRSHTRVRTPHPLVDDEPVSPLAATIGLVDITNGVAVRVDPREVAFPNLDLTIHLLRTPQWSGQDRAGAGTGGWLGLDTQVSFGSGGLGITQSVLHDDLGPFAISAQTLTVRP